MVQSTNSIAVSLELIQTNVMYVSECTCLLYCDENHVVLLGILSIVFKGTRK